MQSNQTKQPIEMHKKYKTRDGRPVRILCVDRKDPVLKVVYAYEVDGFEGIACEDIHGENLIEVHPWEDFKIDDPVLVSDDKVNWHKRHFAGISVGGSPMAFNNGWSSFTVEQELDVTSWNFCKKPDQA